MNDTEEKAIWKILNEFSEQFKVLHDRVKQLEFQNNHDDEVICSLIRWQNTYDEWKKQVSDWLLDKQNKIEYLEKEQNATRQLQWRPPVFAASLLSSLFSHYLKIQF